MPKGYDRLELRISRDVVIADAGSMGSCQADLDIPFDDPELQKDLEALRYQYRRATMQQTMKEKERLDAHIQSRGGWASLMQEVGGRLFEDLLTAGVRDRYYSCLDAAQRGGRGLRVVLEFALDSVDGSGKGDPTVSLPWEYLYDPQRHFHLGCSGLTLLSRRMALPRPTAPFTTYLPLRILAVVATPLDAGYHEQVAPRRALEDGLRSAGSEEITMDFIDQPTFERLKQLLGGGYYDVLHFIGHGYFHEQAGGVLWFEDAFGAGDPVAADALAQALHGGGVRMVFLTACLSAATATEDTFAGTAHTLVQRGIPAVIAMQYTLPVVSAFVFVRSFYQTLGAATGGIDWAVAQARLALHGSSEAVTPRDWGIPVMYLQPDSTAITRKRRRKKEKERPQLLSESEVPNNLHETDILRAANFVGREEDLIRIAKAMRETGPAAGKRRFVTVTGMAGVGKTAAAVECARWHLERGYFAAGIVWTDARDGLPLDSLLNRVGAVLRIEGFEQGRTADKDLAVRQMLDRHDLLIIVDNAEGLVGDSEIVGFLRALPREGRGMILLTSRREFGIDGEQLVELRRLGLEPSVQLFLFKWGRDEPSADQFAQIMDICGPDLLDGHPMSIELVGSLARRERLEELGGLQKRLRTQMMEVLEEKTATGKEISVRASLDMSYTALSKSAQDTLQRVAVFSAHFDEDAASAVCRGIRGWRKALNELLVASLLERRQSRYTTHPVIREYAYEKLGEKKKYHLLAAKHFLSEKGGNPLPAVDHFYAAEEWAAVVVLANAMAERLHTMGLWGATRPRLEKAVEAARASKDRRGEGASLGNLGIFHASVGEMKKAIGYYEQALEISSEIGDRQGEATHLGNMGNAYGDLGQLLTAIGYCERALEISRELGDRRGEESNLGNLGNAYADVGEVRKAIGYYEQALEISRELGGRRGEGAALGSLGNASVALGEVQKAIGYYEQVMAISREIGDRQAEGAALGNLGLAYVALGQAQKAIGYCEQALEISRDMGDRHGGANHLGTLGNAYADLGEVEQAMEYHGQALEISREIGDRRGEETALSNLANAFAAHGEVQKAIEYYEQALEISREIGDRRGEETALGNLGNAYAALGQLQKATEYYEQALAISRRIADRQGEGTGLGNLGAAYHRLGDVQEAIEYYKQALEITREIGNRRVEGDCLGNLGLAYSALAETQSAIGHYKQALEISREIGDQRGQGRHLYNLGDELVKAGDNERALACLLSAVELGGAIGDPRVTATKEGIVGLKKDLGQDEFARLLERVEPNKERIIDEMLAAAAATREGDAGRGS